MVGTLRFFPPYGSLAVRSGSWTAAPRMSLRSCGLQAHVRILAARNARVMHRRLALRNRRAQGMPGAVAPAASCARNAHCDAHEFSAGTTEHTRHPLRNGLRLIRALPGVPLFDSHILKLQSCAIFDATEGFEAYAHYLRTGLSVVGGPSPESSNDPGGEGERSLWVRVLLFVGSSFELRRQRFQHRLVIRLERLDQFFLRRSVTGANQLHDRDRRHSGG